MRTEKKKIIDVLVIVIFLLLILLPIITFNYKPNQVSEIDNRNLTEWPFGAEGVEDLSGQIEAYVDDRIGFRSQMIEAYTALHDKMFDVMVHPTYTYGKDGYIFFKIPRTPDGMNPWLYAFADMVEEIQEFCQEREIPFLFVLNPAKLSVLQEYIPDGVEYSNEWVRELDQELQKRGICFIDLTDLLIEKTEEGEVVFNRKYNAGHWNDLGAFYGVNAMIETLNENYPQLDIPLNKKEDFEITMIPQNSLQVSRFAIEDEEPIFSLKREFEEKTEEYPDLELHEQFRGFNYRVAKDRKLEDGNRLLCFQGSYMNGMGYKFLINSFDEYIAIHDYQNILNFEYYFDLFDPDIVIFEAAEYTLNSDAYFDSAGMEQFHLE